MNVYLAVIQNKKVTISDDFFCSLCPVRKEIRFYLVSKSHILILLSHSEKERANQNEKRKENEENYQNQKHY